MAQHVIFILSKVLASGELTLRIAEDQIRVSATVRLIFDQVLTQAYTQTDVGSHQGETTITKVAPKKIVTLALEQPLPALKVVAGEATVQAISSPTWRVGQNQGLPDPQIIEQLHQKIAQWEGRLADIEAKLSQAEGKARYVLEHQFYVVKRELVEYLLSARLNERKLAVGGTLDAAYLFTPDEEIAQIGLQLNRLRIKRRIYDYVIEVV